MPTFGKISFQGDRGSNPKHLSKTSVLNPTDGPSLATLAEYIKTNITDCTLAAYSIAEQQFPGEAAPGTDVNVDKIAVFYMKDADFGTTVSMTIGGYKPAIVDGTGDGDRVLQAVVEGLAAALSTATGRTIVGSHGVILQKK